MFTDKDGCPLGDVPGNSSLSEDDLPPYTDDDRAPLAPIDYACRVAALLLCAVAFATAVWPT